MTTAPSSVHFTPDLLRFASGSGTLGQCVVIFIRWIAIALEIPANALDDWCE
jgi:hypothetical protein